MLNSPVKYIQINSVDEENKHYINAFETTVHLTSTDL